MPNKKQNLLIIHQGSLGDFVLIFPAIIRLHKYFDSIDVLCQSELGKLAMLLELIENRYPLEAACMATLFTGNIDPKIKALLTPYAKIILFSMSSELEKTIRQITSKPCCRIASKPPPHVRIHLTEFVLEKLTDCQLIEKSDAVLADIPLPTRGIRSEYGKRILLHPGAGSIRKRWSISNFLEVEAMLKADEFNPEFILGPAEADLGDALHSPGRRVHILTDLPDLAALLNSAGGYIGNDSGATHLAAFLGVPTGVIFGPTDPKRWSPVGRAVKTVRPDLGCRPCFETETVNCEEPSCIEKTTPQTVIKAFYRVYSDFGKEIFK